MRYERSAGAAATVQARLSKRWRVPLVLFTVAIMGGIVYFANAGAHSYATVTGNPAAVHAVEQEFFAANVLIENLGAPRPPSISTSSWLVTSHRIASDRRGVIAPSFPWIDKTGSFHPLGAVASHRVFAEQSSVIASIFRGFARAQVTAELNQIVHEERGTQPRISAPGGASILKWLRVQVSGAIAHLEADVNVWESVPTLQTVRGQKVLIRDLNANQVDATATLDRVGGRWFVSSLTQAPWQQAT